jgi:RNA polymerase sigma-70 factor (ECF subfamily)
MPAEANPESASTAVTLPPAVEEAAKRLYRQVNAGRFGISAERFLGILAEVIAKATAANAKAALAGDFTHAGASEAEALEILGLLRVEELVLARACAAGNAVAWDEFLNRYRAKLYEAALSIAHDEASARELADGLYAELYGLPSASGMRTSKLASYMGRGSLEGWLRTVLVQAYVDRYRAQKRTVSLEEQMEAGASFAASSAAAAPALDARLEKATALALATLTAEEKFLLAAYFLDGQTLAELGRQLRVHESTISRKLERITHGLRKGIRRQLLAQGMSPAQADECLQQTDVRDLGIDVKESLGQENLLRPFYKGDDGKT